MTTTLMARPTTYNGIKMRSRLEARFAAFLDRAGMEWEYEPQAFASERGQYLPDFRLVGAGPLGDLYIEVKGALPPVEDRPAITEGMEIILKSEPAASLAVFVSDFPGPKIKAMVKSHSFMNWRPGGFTECSAGHIAPFVIAGQDTPILWCQPETGPLDEIRAYLNPFEQS